ncbi:MAG: PucR family transcriptional regulator ligand-binding domain-containing protein, partial [Nocardioides sp.]|uniref:PucR family transcriptional regulator ligand-binding domain-containing protein n=1 Tax=Nocardioides sp. TaxID=35761 RepID=UPI0039E6A4F4
MLTVSDVLELPIVRSADPVVLAGSPALDRPVHWVHSTELADIAPLLRGGDLVLTTGIALADDPEALVTFVHSLVESGAAGLMIELGRRWRALPDPLVEAADRLGLPLVALRRVVRFAAITQAVGERLVDQQLAELREAQRVHDTFTELSVAEAGPEEILAATQQLSGSAVAWEGATHQVLDYRPGPGDVADFLADWERRSRAVDPSERTAWDASNGWLLSRIGRPQRGWGRLVIESPTPPTARLRAVAERAAAALAMHRLHDRNRDSRQRRLHQELLARLLATPGEPELARQAAMAGIAVSERRYVGLALRPATPGPIASRAARTGPAAASELDELVAACLRAAEVVGRACLVAASDAEVRVLLPLPVRGSATR